MPTRRTRAALRRRMSSRRSRPAIPARLTSRGWAPTRSPPRVRSASSTRERAADRARPTAIRRRIPPRAGPHRLSRRQQGEQDPGGQPGIGPVAVGAVAAARAIGRLTRQLVAGGALVALRIQNEHLGGDSVADRVQGAQEGPNLASGQSLDRLAEIADARVLEEHALLAQALVLAHLREVLLGRRQGVLEHDDQRVASRPFGPRACGTTAELLLEQADHFTRNAREKRPLVAWKIWLQL